MHLLVVVSAAFPWGLEFVGCVVFLCAFRPMYSLWDQWLVSITNYLEKVQGTD